MKFLPLLALFLGFQSASQPVPRTWELPEGVKTAVVNGYEMAYVERGSGDPVIFVPGAGTDYRYWLRTLDSFSVKYRAIAVSLRHFYPEPWQGEGDYGINQHVLDLAEFIKSLNAGPVHLVGHSRGGTVALYTTSKVPGLIRTLTFAEGGIGMTSFSPTDPVLVEKDRNAYRAMSEKLKEGKVDEALEIFVDNVSGPGSWQKLPETNRGSLRANAWTLAAGQIDLPRYAPFSCEDAKRLHVPVLLLGGESSPASFKAVLDNIQPCLHGSTREVIKNSSHSMPRMNPDGFNTAVMTFIAAH